MSGGLPRWWVLPLEMLSMCTCYSWLHWRWFGYVSPSYCTMWTPLVLAHFRFLLDHMSGPYSPTCQFFYWHTGHVAVGPCVTSSLDQVSCFYSSTWRDHNTPRVFLLLDHVSRCCMSACQYFIGPRVTPRPAHMSFLIQPWGKTDMYHIWPTCPVLALTCAIH